MPDTGLQHKKDADSAHEAMACVMEHYIRHHEVVLKKLTHARDATVASIREIEDMVKRLDTAAANDELKEVRKYDGLWAAIIEMSRHAGVSEEELSRIEDVLTEIPRAIKLHYDSLLKQDKALLEMIEQLSHEKYRRAFDVIRKAQSGPNMMSGLEPDEYDMDNRLPIVNVIPPDDDGGPSRYATMVSGPQKKKNKQQR